MSCFYVTHFEYKALFERPYIELYKIINFIYCNEGAYITNKFVDTVIKAIVEKDLEQVNRNLKKFDYVFRTKEFLLWMIKKISCQKISHIFRY